MLAAEVLNEHVASQVSPLVSGEAKDWLKRWTRPISKIKSPFPGQAAGASPKATVAVA